MPKEAPLTHEAFRRRQKTVALDGLLKRTRPKFQVNYHSAAQLQLYGVG